jgi:hypothetical protein
MDLHLNQTNNKQAFGDIDNQLYIDNNLDDTASIIGYGVNNNFASYM